jgi:hypothetical protein
MASGSTGNYSIPYPIPTDPVNVTGDIEALATRIDNILQEEIEDTAAAMWTSGGTFSNGLQAPTYNDTTGKMSMSLSQDLQTSASPTFVNITATNQLISSVAAGTSPISVSSSTVVTNLNSDLLDGEQGSFYLDWTNVTNKPDPTITFLGNVSGSVTLTDVTSASVTIEVIDDSHSHTSVSVSNLDVSAISTGILPVIRGGTGVSTSTGTTNLVLSNSPTLTGTPIAPTASVDTNTTQIATTAYVIGQGYLKSTTASSTYAPINNPTFTGTVSSNGTLFKLNADATSGTEDIFITVERGSDPDVSIRWNEDGDTWQFTNDGENYVDIGSGGSGGAGLEAVLMFAGM